MATKELRDRVDAQWGQQAFSWSQENHDRERKLIYDYLDQDENIMGLVGCTWGSNARPDECRISCWPFQQALGRQSQEVRQRTREMEVSLSTLDRMISKGEVEVVREGRRVYVRMHGPEYPDDEELLRRAIMREDELERTVREVERSSFRVGVGTGRGQGIHI